MNRLIHAIVWFSRIHRCLGFGIQSPTDYAFVRHVINEHLPYYAYERLGLTDGWYRRRLGLLYFRLANWRQPEYVMDTVGVEDYVASGCRRASFSSNADHVDLAILRTPTEAFVLLPKCNDHSVMVIEHIKQDGRSWRNLLSDDRVTISFDLYDVGILWFDSKRSKQHYIVNF